MSRIIDADKLLEHLNELLVRDKQYSYSLEHECSSDDTCTACYMKAAIELVQTQPAFSEDFADNLLNIGYAKGYNKAIDDFISKLDDARDNVIPFDDYDLGTRAGYQYSIELAEQLKGGEKIGDSNSGNT